MISTARTALRAPQNVARLSRTFATSLCARDVAEPLLSLDENQPVTAGKELTALRKVSVLGVRCSGLVAGWAAVADLTEGTLGECAREFRAEEVLDESAGLDRVLGVFGAADCVFVEWCGEVMAVITRRDLQKPPLRMWLFGAITVLDANLTWAVGELYPNDAWQSQITPGRLQKAARLLAERRRRGSQCTLVDCLQMSDKADILMTHSASVAALGLHSRREAERLMQDIQMLRNHLAHAQELEAEHLATAVRLASFIPTILRAEGVQRIVDSQRTSGDAAPQSIFHPIATSTSS